jgi:hypothetical protein
MTDSGGYKYVGGCACGWQGSRRVIDADAVQDIRRHCAETGCLARQHTDDVLTIYEDELMPHERAKLRREKE